MTFIVTYRDKGGRQSAEAFEAESREALFRSLSSRGISAIRVEATEGASGNANRRRGPSVVRACTVCARRRIAAAIVAVAAAAGGTWWLLGRGVPHGDQSSTASPASPSKLTPPAPQGRTLPPGTPVSANAATVSDRPDGNAPLDKIAETNVFDEAAAKEAARIQKWKDKYARRKSIFDNASDQILGMIASAPPGRDMPPLPLARSIDRDFMESLKTPIAINDDDNESVKALKEAVMRLRAEVLAVKESEGLSVYEILSQHQNLVRENAAIRVEAQQEALEIYRSGDVNGAQEYVDKMNDALGRLGAEPIRMPGEPNLELRRHIRERLDAMKNVDTRKREMSK